MPNTRIRGIPVIKPDPKLERTLRRMDQNLGIQGDEVYPQMPPLVIAHDPVLPDIRGEGEIRRQPPAPRPLEYYRDMKISQTLMGHSSCSLYHTATLLW